MYCRPGGTSIRWTIARCRRASAGGLGRQSADDLLARHFQDFGSHPKAIGLSAWGTSNMRTGGEMDHISGWVDEATGSFDQLLLAERLR